jgi:DNA-binding MarR family transcriptional regulator
MQTSLTARWALASGMTADDRQALLLRQPCIEDAMRRLSHNMLALAAGDRAIDGIVKDAGRFFAAGMAMTLHATGGLTLPRLKEFCIETGLISPGRARALLLYLRFLRYVEPVPGAKRGSAYVPTASMRNAWGAITRAGLDAVQVMEPEIAPVTQSIADPAVLFAFCRIQSEIGRDLGARGMDNTFWRVFLNRHAGTQILHALMQGAGDTVHYPPRGEIAVSLSKLARDFHVSRPHVARMLRAGEKEGLLELRGSNQLAFTEEGRQHLTRLMSARLGSDLETAIRLKAELDAQENLRKTA